MQDTQADLSSSTVFPSRDLARKWFGDQIPDLERRALGFMTDLNVVDAELLELFSTEIDNAMTGLIPALVHEDVETIREIAHTLQGMGGTVGAPEVSVLGEELSRQARDGDFSRCRHLLAALQGWRTEWILPDHPSTSLTARMPRLNGQLLIVDDEVANRRFLEKLLGDCGADVRLAENGDQALEMILRHRPDVALVDVMMPGIDGYEVCRRICASPELRQTLVIMVTARNTVQDIEHAFLQGAFDYIRKPFHSRELVARVRNALLLKQRTDALRSWQMRMSRELEMAGAVQSKLFNPLPLIGQRVDVHVAYRPSQQVGGDMFDLHSLSDGRLMGYVADVAGHGVASALISTLIKGLMAEIIFSLHLPPLHGVANELHQRFRACVLEPEIYATLLLFRVDPETRTVESLSCGHPAPIVLGQEGQSWPDLVGGRGGMPIGMLPLEMGMPYAEEDEVRFPLPEEASLFVYTDGLIEARNPRREEVGSPGLERILSQTLFPAAGLPELGTVLEALLEEGFDYRTDDCTLLQIQVPRKEDILLDGECACTLEEVDGLSRQIAESLEQDGWHADDGMLIRLLVLEQATNVVKHGRVAASECLLYRLTRHAAGALLVIADPGCDWVESEAVPLGDELAESGRGLELMRTICPHLLRFRRENLNHAVFLLEKGLSLRVMQATEPPENFS